MKQEISPEYILGLFKEIATAQAKTDAQFAVLQQKQVEETADLKKSLKAFSDDTNKQIKALGENLGGLGNSLGDAAEEYFYNSLVTNPIIGNQKFDRVETNRKGFETSSGSKYEFDMVLVNGKSIAILETKHKATKKAIEQLERAVHIARDVMPEYKKYSVYGGIASFSIDDKLKALAHAKGFFVLQRSGNTFVAEAEKMKAF